MSAAEALKAARVAGVQVGIDDDDLVLESSAPPPSAILDQLSQQKAGIVMLLRPGHDGWSAEDWQAFFEKRADIAEFDRGLPRALAEARAFTCCAAEWLNRNPVRSPPGHCLGCGNGDHAHSPLLPFGIDSSGYAWLHPRCWPAWHAGRKAEAVAALAAMGITTPANFQIVSKKMEENVGAAGLGGPRRVARSGAADIPQGCVRAGGGHWHGQVHESPVSGRYDFQAAVAAENPKPAGV